MIKRKNSFYNRQTGIGLPAAIFVITLMALLAVAINVLVGQSSQTFEEEVNLTRAFYAAESGAGFAMNRLFPPEEYPGYAGAAECVESPPAVYSLTVPGLNSCSVSVTCKSSGDIGGNNYATIDSIGNCGDVSRAIQVRAMY